MNFYHRSQLQRRFLVRTYWALTILIAVAFTATLIPVYSTHAADPTSGTLNPTTGATVSWTGTASGGASNDESTCVDGVNCDTYTLNVSGTPANWSGKDISIKILSGPASDYDLVVHKNSNTGPIVGSSGNAAGQPEEVVIIPSSSGTGVYTVHVIYFAAVSADPPRGSATVIAGEATEPTPTPSATPPLPASCTPPGTQVTTDPAGDQTGAPENQQLDITRLSIAEPNSAAGEEKLSFSIEVADLSTIPPNGAWRAQFTPPGTAPPTTQYYVAAESDATGAVTYTYGRLEGTSVATSEATDGSVDMANKRFVINVLRSNILNPQPGQNLTDVHARTQLLVGAAGTGVLAQIDTTRVTTDLKIYTIRGNAGCATTPTEPTPTPTPTPEPTPDANAPRFAVHQSPQGLGDSAGEPTLGVNWQTGKVMFIAGLQVLRVAFDDCTSPSTATWQLTNQTVSNINTLDPILFTDNDTGNGANRTNRTFVSQLAAADGSSQFEYTDDDGQSYMQNPKGSGIGSGVDHQTVGGGPYAKNSDGSLKGGAVQIPDPSNSKFPNLIYPNAVYYASQNIGYANLARSDNGGRTYNPAIPMYDLTTCGGLHGHIKVAGDGTIYVPNKGCGGQQAVAVSEDNGVTFQVRKVPTSKPGDNDPSVGIGSDGTVYFGYSNADGRPRIAVSRDKGVTWTDDQGVGQAFGIRSSVFPAVVAGDGDRAAFFFLGSNKPGGRDDDPVPEGNTTAAYDGTWYAYIATTYDRGKTWTTVNATPKDPVQRGVVCTNGTTCPSGTRNLLDFNDVTSDAQGRILAGLADGCVSEGCINGVDKNSDGKLNRFDNDGADKGTIIRQSGGRTLLAAFDDSGARVPPAPRTLAFYDPQVRAVRLMWERPESDTEITGYIVYRMRGGQETQLAALGADEFNYTDAEGMASDRYRVAAVNAFGQSPATCGVVTPVVLQSPCTAPGQLVVADIDDAAPNAPVTPEVNIQSVLIAEPVQNDNIDRLIFTMNVNPSTTGQAPPNSQWFIIFNRQVPEPEFDRFYVAMKSDAAGVLRFDYGKFGIPLATTDPNPNANIPVKIGDADAGTYNPTTGVITITLARSKADGVQAGQTLNGVNARTFLNQPDQGPKSQRTAADITGEGTYKVVGSAACAPIGINLVGDSFVRGAEVDRNKNFGASPELQVKRTLNPGSGRGRRAYMRLDLTNVPTEFRRATLRVYGRLNAVNNENRNIPMAAFAVTTPFEELGITWNNQPSVAEGPTQLSQVVVTDDVARFYEFDITDFVKRERAAGRLLTGVVLRNMIRGGVGDFYTVLNSKEAAANKPQLVIQQF